MNYYNYFTEIEETFVRRRGKHLLLSPLDWAMIEGWQERGVPLHVVIRGIETVFDTFDRKPSNRSIKGLLYCREEIEAQYAEWIASQAGGGNGNGDSAEPATDRAGIEAHIDAAVEALGSSQSAALREDFERARLRLLELKENLSDDLETIDGSLGDVEKLLENALLARSDPERRAAVEKEIAGQLKSYKSSMDADAYKQTFDLMVIKRLRELEGVPRLGLFYL